MVRCLSYRKNVILCTLIVLGAFISGVKCIGESCSSSSDCGYSEKCCRQTSVGSCRFETTPCLGDYCSSNTQCPSNSVCCGHRCVPGNNCVGRSCVLQSGCGFDESCCNDVCVQGKDCSGQGCSYDHDCSGGQVCCGKKCKNGTKCSLNIIIPVTAACAFIVIVAIVVFGYFYNRKRQQRLVAFSNVPFGHLTQSTTSHLPQPAINTFQQPPPLYTATVTPPQYTLTSSNGSDGMNATFKASVTSPNHQ